MRQDDRALFDQALAAARSSAYPPGQFVGQESFMQASEILTLALRARVAPGVRVLDLCCGVAGPGRHLTAELGCSYVGVDASRSAVEIARERAVELSCRFEVAEVPPVPAGPFDVVLLLETMLAFRDKETLLGEVAAVLSPGGRFAFTLEEGRPLTAAEAGRMPDADTVWLTPLPEVLGALDRAGLRVEWSEEHGRRHLEVVDAMVLALTREQRSIADRVGDEAVRDLLEAHRLWSEWLGTGRVRKFSIVAELMP